MAWWCAPGFSSHTLLLMSDMGTGRLGGESRVLKVLCVVEGGRGFWSLAGAHQRGR